MHATLIGTTTTNGTLSWTADLGDYARWEYGRDAEAWLLATARTARARRRKRPSIRARVRAWLRTARSLPATAVVAEVENRGR